MCKEKVLPRAPLNVVRFGHVFVGKRFLLPTAIAIWISDRLEFEKKK